MQRGKPAKEKVRRSFADLPSSITTCILLQLPIKSVSICKCVCKTWNELISDTCFATLYSQHASLGFMIRTNLAGQVSDGLHHFECKPEKVGMVNVKFDPKFKLPLPNAYRKYGHSPEDDIFDVVNSCNGLLCLCEPNGMSINNLVVCNPITGEFIRLPEATGIMKTTRKAICAGLGFQPKTNEYKVVRMWKINDGNAMIVEMHTLGTTIWKNIEVDPKFLSLRLESPASVNGALHWINFDGKIRSIVCFDFESERLRSFPSPPPPSLESNVLCISMVELKGFLYFYESIFNSCVVWLMKKYGIGESWTKVFCTEKFGGSPWRFSICRPIKHFENGGGALLLQWDYKTDSFVYFEPECSTIFYLFIWDKSVCFESIPYNPSFISLKNIVKGKNIEVQNVHSPCVTGSKFLYIHYA